MQGNGGTAAKSGSSFFFAAFYIPQFIPKLKVAFLWIGQ